MKYYRQGEILSMTTHSETKIKKGRMWPDWYHTLRIFRASNSLKATLQLINTVIPYFCLWYLTIRSIQLGYPFILTLFFYPDSRCLSGSDVRFVS